MSDPEHPPGPGWAARAVTVSEACQDDAQQLFKLVRAAFLEYRGRLDPTPRIFREGPESVAAHVGRGGALVARVGADAVGCVFYTREADHLYTGRLAVLPAWRRGGVGGVLLAAAERRAVELGYARVRLNVRAPLTHLVRYYTACGYVLIREHSHPGYSVTTYVEMEKILPPRPPRPASLRPDRAPQGALRRAARPLDCAA